MKMQASMPAIILMTVGVAALGSWKLSDTETSKQAHETGKNTRVAISQTLPRMDGDHLESKAIEVTYQPGASSPAHSHSCPVLAYVAEGTIRSQVNDEPEHVYKVGETFYEAPNGVHRVSANASQTEPAKLIAFFVCDHEGPITVEIPASNRTNHK
jgi:quercetin dioxygenase-like cupin family protein